MEFEAALLLIGVFLALAIGFWMAAEHPRGADREPVIRGAARTS